MDWILGRAGSVWAGAFVVVGGVVFVASSLGCMNLSFGGKTQVVSPDEGHTSAEGVQRGKAYVPPGQEVRVYYPTPYISAPNLEFEDSDSKRNIQIVDQKPDHVRLKNMSGSGVELAWKARGNAVSTTKAPAPGNAVQVTAP